MWRTNVIFILLLVISFIFYTEQTQQRSSRSHSIHKRSCNVRGEECFKDIECCTGECVCSKNMCKCGNRPKVKVSKLMQPQSMAQRLICRYR
ncbi:hypothetical protein CDAR_444891 [Caerostris darwini]|uniref:Uncharacterized protein n=1 Tax=Caerostris darwini TaxID=1538125 RepID=A0AAV4NWL1_9ARAC|nr:hypothetical protein CDAR_444891 [Caerostris darwini]